MSNNSGDARRTDGRDTGEHFFGALVNTPPPEPDAVESRAAARRLADLTTQIDFLDAEVARYRELVESERIKHATELANQQLAADSRLDDVRREERVQTQALHDSYRSLLNEHQLEHEKAISRMASDSAATLASERKRHEEIVKRERDRRRARVEATRQQTSDEVSASQKEARRNLLNELTQAATTIERLQGELDGFVERTQRAEMASHDYEVRLAAMQQRLDTVEERHHAQLNDVQAQVTASTRRLEAERQRSAATLADLLEHSASLAADADEARSNFAAEQARAKHIASSERQRAADEYAAFVAAADERASRSLEREGDLEAVIAELRDRLGDKRP